MSAAVIGGLSELCSNGYVKIAALVAIFGACPIWLLSLAYTAIQASVGGN